MLFIGLGNPGNEYHETRHNAGFMVLDKLAERLSFNFRKPFFKNYLIAKGFHFGKPLIFIKPLTYMNNSGLVLDYIPSKYFQNDGSMVVICDNMDLSTGECRIKTKGSITGHNGMSSIIENYGSEDFIRIYVGISRPESGTSIISHVLGKPERNEQEKLNSGVERASYAAEALINSNVQRVMNEYNRRNN
ncbi:MAG: aminoacyl-tRNA hydrolase [Spirochaetaceae bacterium]|nr:aminoacyl-tRNA hydrolase [Spirochaetaceae bacterium]